MKKSNPHAIVYSYRTPAGATEVRVLYNEADVLVDEKKVGTVVRVGPGKWIDGTGEGSTGSMYDAVADMLWRQDIERIKNFLKK